MASIKQQETKSGKRFFLISVSRGYGRTPYTKRWYWPDGWSKRSAEREAAKQAAEFERACAAGEVLNRAEAKEKAAQEAAERAKLKSFKAYALDVYMASKAQSFSENSKASYTMLLTKHIFPVFGDLLMVDISTAMINAFLLDMQQKGYKKATITKIFNILSGVFIMAYMDESLSSNPMLRARKPVSSKDESAGEESKALTADELAQVLVYVAQEPLKWQTYISLAADTGARRGELCGLQWQDIDWKSGAVTIRRNLQYTAQKGVYVTSPKNGRARTVDVGSDVLALLHQLLEEQAKSCLSVWVFTQDGTAEPMFPQSPTKYFRKFGEKYNIPNFHPHLLRHTSASIALTNGADIVSVSERLGHSDTAITLRLYSHANPESIRNAGQKARDAVKKAQNG